MSFFTSSFIDIVNLRRRNRNTMVKEVVNDEVIKGPEKTREFERYWYW